MTVSRPVLSVLCAKAGRASDDTTAAKAATLKEFNS
jgi:hypothetical protein